MNGICRFNIYIETNNGIVRITKRTEPDDDTPYGQDPLYNLSLPTIDIHDVESCLLAGVHVLNKVRIMSGLIEIPLIPKKTLVPSKKELNKLALEEMFEAY
jgi:hypothetical protein